MPRSDDPKRRLPRDSGFSMELREGTGGITAMCACGDFMEFYKEDTTFRVRTPESIDPERTNPNATTVAAVSDNVGSASPVVARVLLQGRDILQMAIFAQTVDKDAIVRRLHACKEALVVCEKVGTRVASRAKEIIEKVQTTGLQRDRRGGALNPFPQVPELEPDATSFLIHAKRAILEICRLPPLLLPVPAKDSNFDKLGNTLAAAIGPEAAVTKFVRNNAATVAYLIDLRNFQEHPDAKRTTISNFAVMPDNSMSVPMWHVSGETPQPIHEEMPAATEFLVRMAEEMLLYLVLHTVDKRWPFIIEHVDATQANPKVPIKYRLSIDLSKLRAGPAPA
jgi:hypothetical protein